MCWWIISVPWELGLLLEDFALERSLDARPQTIFAMLDPDPT